MDGNQERKRERERKKRKGEGLREWRKRGRNKKRGDIMKNTKPADILYSLQLVDAERFPKPVVGSGLLVDAELIVSHDVPN